MRRRWQLRRGTGRALLLALALVLLAQPVAVAASDLFSNVGPGSGSSGLAERYPLGNYALDHHFTAIDAGVFSGVDVSGVPPLIAYFLADVLWQLTAFLANALITLFGFAFSLDLVNGGGATSGAGALAPVSQAVRSIYRHVFGATWLAVSVALAGLWALWKALVQRRYAETAGALGLSLVFVVIALAFVTQPERTVGSAARWSDRMSVAFLSLADRGTVSDGDRARRAASDQLFTLLVYEPWVVLDFGGLEHCVQAGTGSGDSDPRSVPVRPLARDPRGAATLARQLAARGEVTAEGKHCVNNARKYGDHFLAYAPDSGARNAEYDALNSGDASKLPDSDPGKGAGTYRLGVADKPATDAMEKGGQYQRLLMALVVFCAELGAFLLLGALSVAVILAQVMVLLLLAFAPVALVAGAYPGRGHDLFRGWLSRLAAFLLRKAIYSLILAVLLAVLAAVGDATAQLGWLMSFGLQAAFLWAVFLYRHQLTGQLVAATAGDQPRSERPLGRLATVYYARALVRRRMRRWRHRGGAGGGFAARSRAPAPDTYDADGGEEPITTDGAPAPAPPSRPGPSAAAAGGEPGAGAPEPASATPPERARPAGDEPPPPAADPSAAGRSPLVDDLRRDGERLGAEGSPQRSEAPAREPGPPPPDRASSRPPRGERQ